jgi:hypothetical protein
MPGFDNIEPFKARGSGRGGKAVVEELFDGRAGRGRGGGGCGGKIIFFDEGVIVGVRVGYEANKATWRAEDLEYGYI